MRLGDTKIGDKYWLNDRVFLRINLDLNRMSLTTKYPQLVCSLDLTTYEVICHNPEYEVEIDKDNIPV